MKKRENFSSIVLLFKLKNSNKGLELINLANKNQGE